MLDISNLKNVLFFSYLDAQTAGKVQSEVQQRDLNGLLKSMQHITEHTRLIRMVVSDLP